MLPKEFRKADGSLRLLDYSVHPPTRLGLHNAMLTRHDRVEILESYGGQFECEVYVVDGMNTHVLTEELAVTLFNSLPSGEVKWTTIREFLLPQQKEAHTPVSESISHEQQLHLFEYAHVADDDSPPHHFDVDA